MWRCFTCLVVVLIFSLLIVFGLRIVIIILVSIFIVLARYLVACIQVGIHINGAVLAGLLTYIMTNATIIFDFLVALMIGFILFKLIIVFLLLLL